jgi:hypothetical protein
MSSMLGDADSQQILTGAEFRSELVQCSGCGWSGTAGQLRSPSSNDLQGDIRYSCPQCVTVVAVHAGLSDDEVKAELDRVKAELKTEGRNASLRHHQESICPDYAEVRNRIRELA